MAQLYFNFNENHTIFDFTKNAFLLMQNKTIALKLKLICLPI